MPLSGTVSRQLVFGRDQRSTKIGLTIGAVLFVGSYLFWRLLGVAEAAYDVLPVDVIGGGFALLLLIAAVHAAYNQGLLISWLLVFLPVFRASLSFVGVGLQSPALGEQVALIVAIPLGAALLLGTAGYLLGRGVENILRSTGTEPA